MKICVLFLVLGLKYQLHAYAVASLFFMKINYATSNTLQSYDNLSQSCKIQILTTTLDVCLYEQ